MGLNVYTQRWIRGLIDKGVIPLGASIMDLGPQDLVRYAPDRATEREMLGKQEVPGDWYRSVGLGEYQSIDLNDERATWRCDLNGPAGAIPEGQNLWHMKALDIRVDVIHNGGTAEHIFNIGQVFRTVHQLLKPGGIALHVLPAAGEITHGYYNIHPQLYRDLAHANGYTIEALDYVADIDGKCLEMIGEPIPQPRPLKDYCYVALRKTSDTPFICPQQGCADA